MKRRLSLPRRSRPRRRVVAFLLIAFCCGAIVNTLLRAEISEEAKKKRDAFLKAREEMRTVGSPTPAKAKSSGKPKAASKKSRTSSSAKKKKKSSSRKSATEDEESGKSSSPSRKEKSSEVKRAQPDEDEAAPPRRATTARPTPDVQPPLPTPEPRQSRSLPPADITIQKSGLEEEQGFAPPPPPPRGFWERLFGGGGGRDRNYRYLSRSVIEAIRRAPVQRSRWKFIIVHNSGTRQGNAKAFDYYHKRVRRMQNGLAYHFVVGNGRSSGNGEIEVGNRWRRQINGGHVHSDYLNNISLGICLVGDFNRDQPTRAQLEATEELIRYLRERCGRVDGRAIPVRPHKLMNPPRWATDCPGDDFPYGWFRRF